MQNSLFRPKLKWARLSQATYRNYSLQLSRLAARLRFALGKSRERETASG